MTARGLFARQVDHVAEETAERGAENMRDSQFLELQFTRHRYTPTRTLPESERNFVRFPGKRPPATSFEAATLVEASICANAVGASVRNSSPAGNFLGESLRNHSKGTVH
jgi:hypothetical protein